MPKDMSSVRYKRLLRVIALLQSHKQATREELESVGEYNTSAKSKQGYEQNRTLQNDLDFLRDEGAVIEYDRHNRVYVLKHNGSLLVNIKITPQEIEILSAGLKMASHFLPHLSNYAKTLWDKLAIYIPRNMAAPGEDIAESTVIAVPVAQVDPKVFDLLINAKYNKLAINIRYSAPGKQKGRQWTLSPYDFYFRGNAWYMISYNHNINALSTHRISRIISAYIDPDNLYVSPDVAGFSKDYVSTAWHIAPGTEKHFVKIKLSGYLAESMREIKWHPTQKIEELQDGNVILTAEVPYLDEVARWVLAGAPNAKVIEPEELKSIVKEFAMKVIED